MVASDRRVACAITQLNGELTRPGPGVIPTTAAREGVFRPPLSNSVNKRATKTKAVSNERSLRDDSKEHTILTSGQFSRSEVKVKCKNRHMCSELNSSVLNDGRRQKKTAKLGVKQKKII